MHQIDDDDPNKHIQYLVSSFNEMCVCALFIQGHCSSQLNGERPETQPKTQMTEPKKIEFRLNLYNE